MSTGSRRASAPTRRAARPLHSGEDARDGRRRPGPLDHYDIPGAYAAVPPFIEALNNWYIRRSRPRFWAEGTGADKQDAFDTLYTALVLACRAMAPLLPLITERIHAALTAETSVHLADWPDVATLPQEAELVRRDGSGARGMLGDLDLARGAPAAGAPAAAQAHRGASRPPPSSAPFKDIIAEEVNVKGGADERRRRLRQARIEGDAQIGAKIGATIEEVLPAAKAGRWTASAGWPGRGGRRDARPRPISRCASSRKAMSPPSRSSVARASWCWIRRSILRCRPKAGRATSCAS